MPSVSSSSVHALPAAVMSFDGGHVQPLGMLLCRAGCVTCALARRFFFFRLCVRASASIAAAPTSAATRDVTSATRAGVDIFRTLLPRGRTGTPLPQLVE